MDDKLETGLLEDYFDRLTFSPTPVPRKKHNNFVSNSFYDSQSDDNDKLISSSENETKTSFDLIVNLDLKSNFNYTTSTMPLPRKPRRNLTLDSKQSSFKIDDTSNDYEDTGNDSYCFFNSSYAVSSANKFLESRTIDSSQFLLKEISEHLPDNYINLDKLNRIRSKTIDRTSTVKLQRPSAPPPPPPKSPHPFFGQTQNYYTEKNSYLNSTKISPIFSAPKLSSTPKGPSYFMPVNENSTHQKILNNRKNFVNIGFEAISLNSLPRKNNFVSKFIKFLKSKLEFFKLKNFDRIVSSLAILLFFICILSISLFQSKANEFYQKFLNKDSKVLLNNATNISENLEYLSAGSDLVKQTVLLCNGPYFSYQINNLIVLPFSLFLVIVFSFFNKRDPCCVGKPCIKRPGLPVITNPFQRKNRFLTAALYCILANEIFKMIESSIFDSSYSESHNKTIEFLNTISSNRTKILNQSNTDFLKIGLGIEPEVFQRRTKIFKTTKKTTRPFFMAPSVLHYSKPKLRPRLNLNDFETTPAPVTIGDFFYLSQNNVDGKLSDIKVNINVAEGVTKYKRVKNKSLEVIRSFNETLNESSNQTLFEASLSLYNNKHVQNIVRKIFESKEFKWSIILEKLKKIGLILIEVLIIGMRYYPLMGILEKNSMICLLLACFYMWFDIFYNITITGLCEGLKLNVSFDFLKEIRRIFGVGFLYDAQEYFRTNIGGKILKNGFKSDGLFDQKEKIELDASLLFSSNRILYTIIKSLPHFFCLSYVTIKLNASFVKMVYKKIKSLKKENLVNEVFYDDYYGKNYTTNSTKGYDLVYTRIYNQINNSKNVSKLSFEDRYVKNLFSTEGLEPQNPILNYFHLLFDKNFRFSTRIICTYTVCFTVLYYFNCFLIFYGSIFIDMIYLPSVYKNSIVFSSMVTCTICIIQLIFSMSQLKFHLKSLYKGNSDRYISPKQLFSNNKIATSSFNYSGLAVTYTCWGYIILFFIITFFSFQFATLIEFGSTNAVFFIIIIIFPFLISAVIFKIVNRFLGSLAARFCFLQGSNKLALKNLKFYSLFLYFKFFYDCFTGIALCFIRMIKSLILSVIFLPRLDYSFMGRSMEKMDTAFMSYVGYLHWESHHTNPITISFCNLLNRINKRKRKTKQFESSSFVKARNKWQLVYLILKNPSLQKFRKRD